MVLTRAASRRLQEKGQEDFFFDSKSETNASLSGDATSLEGGSEEEKKKSKRPKEVNVMIGTLNIRDGRGGKMEMACNRLQRLLMDVMVITETKFSGGRHTHESYGYEIFATDCQNKNQGGVAIIVRKNKLWHVEDVERHGPNMITCIFVCGNRRVTIVGVYIPPSEIDASTVTMLDTFLQSRDSKDVIVLGDLNVNYADPKDKRSDKIVDTIFTHNLYDLSTRLSTRRKKPYTWTWRVIGKGRWCNQSAITF